MVRRVLAASFVVGAGFAAGFCFAAWCIGEGIKDGSLDNVVADIRAKRRRMEMRE